MHLSKHIQSWGFQNPGLCLRVHHKPPPVVWKHPPLPPLKHLSSWSVLKTSFHTVTPNGPSHLLPQENRRLTTTPFVLNCFSAQPEAEEYSIITYQVAYSCNKNIQKNPFLIFSGFNYIWVCAQTCDHVMEKKEPRVRVNTTFFCYSGNTPFFTCLLSLS